MADSQVASRWGNITEFKGFDLITPNEREARFALADQDSGIRPLASTLYDVAKCKTLMLKLGERGVLTCRRQRSRVSRLLYRRGILRRASGGCRRRRRRVIGLCHACHVSDRKTTPWLQFSVPWQLRAHASSTAIFRCAQRMCVERSTPLSGKRNSIEGRVTCE